MLPGNPTLMNAKARLPSDIGTIVGGIVCLTILAHSPDPDWTPRFIHQLAGLFVDTGQSYIERPIILILCVGGGRLIGYMIGRLFRRIRHHTTAD